MLFNVWGVVFLLVAALSFFSIRSAYKGGRKSFYDEQCDPDYYYHDRDPFAVWPLIVILAAVQSLFVSVGWFVLTHQEVLHWGWFTRDWLWLAVFSAIIVGTVVVSFSVADIAAGYYKYDWSLIRGIMWIMLFSGVLSYITLLAGLVVLVIGLIFLVVGWRGDYMVQVNQPVSE